VGCSTSGTSNTDKSLSDIEYEDFLNDYTESVQIHTKTLESLSEGIEIMTEDNFQSFEDVLTSQKRLLTTYTLPEQYGEVTELWLLSIDEYLTHVHSYEPDMQCREVDMDSFSKGTDYFIEAKQTLEENKDKN
jgi:hypothetical protein